MTRPTSLLAVALLSAQPAVAHADEGQWMPEQLPELDADQLRAMGLKLPADKLWGEDGLMRAAVNLSGCSAGFVSAKGLISTNHHCAYAAIQAQSSVEHDYLSDGFLAAAQGDELEGKGLSVRVLQSITDVSDKVLAAAAAAGSPAEAAKAVELERNRIVKECEDKDPALRCSVAQFYSGSLFQLFEAIQLRDVRLVYAPPSSIGNYGGEVDNWMWPRHTADFTLVRAYVGPDGKPADYAPDNVPYEPKQFFEVGHEGVAPGDFVAVLGYPGHTDRYLPYPEVERQVQQVLPRKIEVYGEWIEILERAGAKDPAIKIKVAATLRSMANRHKNARGMLEGIDEIGLLPRRKAEDEQMARWASNQGAKAAVFTQILPQLTAIAGRQQANFEQAFILSNLRRTAGTLAIAIDLVRRAREAAKPDLERASGYMERDLERLWRRQQRRLRDFDAGVDKALLASVLTRLAALPPNLRPTATKPGAAAGIVGRTKLGNPDTVKALFDAADAKAIASSRDPMIVLARDLVDQIERNELADRERDGLMLKLGPRYFEMVKSVRTGPVYPDANGTLRFSYATVKGYAPRDGMSATPQTTLSGQVAKHTGVAPFDLPAAVREAAPEAGKTYWADPGLGDVPVAFLSTADTTGGNSGSPVINGRGQWVGQNFDRVWENIAGDFGYSTKRSRNITADVRYLLWLLDDVADATRLLEELGVADKREAPVRTAAPTSADAPPSQGDGGAPVGPIGKRAKPRSTKPHRDADGGGDGGCGCSHTRGNPGAALLALLFVAFGGGRTRRRGQT